MTPPPPIPPIPGLEVQSVTRTEAPAPRWTVQATYSPETPPCPHCGAKEVHFRGSRGVSVSDIPHLETPVQLEIRCPDYGCTKCGRRFMAERPFMSEGRRITPRLMQWIRDRTNEPKWRLCWLTGLGSSTLRHIMQHRPIKGRKDTSPPQG